MSFETHGWRKQDGSGGERREYQKGWFLRLKTRKVYFFMGAGVGVVRSGSLLWKYV